MRRHFHRYQTAGRPVIYPYYECGHMRSAQFAPPYPCGVDLPRVATLRQPNVFTNFHTCLLNRILAHDEGLPTKCIFPKKETTQIPIAGWNCRYDGTFRPFIHPTVAVDSSHAKSGKVSGHNQPPSAGRPELSDTDTSSSDYLSVASADHDGQLGELESVSISDDDRPCDLAFLFSESENDSPRRSKRRPQRNGAPASMADMPRIPSTQHDYITDQLSPHIDPEKYTLLVNTLEAIATVRWQPSERSDALWKKCSTAKTHLEKNGKKKLSASCIISLDAHSVDAIQERIVGWSAWHASWVYGVRPVSLRCGLSRSDYFNFPLFGLRRKNELPHRTKPHGATYPVDKAHASFSLGGGLRFVARSSKRLLSHGAHRFGR